MNKQILTIGNPTRTHIGVAINTSWHMLGIGYYGRTVHVNIGPMVIFMYIAKWTPKFFLIWRWKRAMKKTMCDVCNWDKMITEAKDGEMITIPTTCIDCPKLKKFQSRIYIPEVKK